VVWHQNSHKYHGSIIEELRFKINRIASAHRFVDIDFCLQSDSNQIAMSLSLAQINSLLQDLRSTTSLEQAVNLALSIASSHTLSLIKFIQAIPRDPENEFAPLPLAPRNHDTFTISATPTPAPPNEDPIDLSDAALLLLSELASINEALLERDGWENLGPGSACGSSIYRHESTGEVAESPSVPSSGDILSRIGVLMSPGVLGGAVVWAVKVIHLNESFAVLDVLKFEGEDEDEEDDATPTYCLMRGIYKLPWQGLAHVPFDELVLSDGKMKSELAPGNTQSHNSHKKTTTTKKKKNKSVYTSSSFSTPALESWTHTTLCGLSLCSSPPDPRILIFGLGVGSIARFLSFHLPPNSSPVGSRLTIIEPNRAAADAFFSAVSKENPLPLNCIVLDENLQPYPYQQIIPQPATDWDVVLLDCGAVPSCIINQGFGPSGDLFRALLDTTATTTNATTTSPRLIAAAVSVVDGARLRTQGKSLRNFREHHLRQDESDDDEDLLQAPPLIDPASSGSSATVVSILSDNAKVSLSLSVSSWHAASGSIFTGAMDVAAAQSTRVVTFPSLLSTSEVTNIKEVGNKAFGLSAGLEVRSGTAPGEPWSVIHLNTKGLFDALLPGLREKLLAVARDADLKEGWGLLPPIDEDVKIRVAEFHTYKGPTVGLPDPRHYDQDSLITVDCMLSQPEEDFEGGVLQTFEVDGTMMRHDFGQGDVVVFVSHKYHSITPVMKGLRHVLVIEFWKGEDRRCGHRCLLFKGRCPLESNGKEEGNSSQDDLTTFDLPFRLGSVAENVDGEWLLLWEPATTAEQQQRQQQKTRAYNARKAVVPLNENDETWQLFD